MNTLMLTASERSQLNRACNLVHENRYPEALQICNRLIAENPAPESFYLLRLDLLTLTDRDVETRLSFLEEALKLPGARASARIWISYGSVLLQAGRLQDAVAACDEALEINQIERSNPNLATNNTEDVQSSLNQRSPETSRLKLALLDSQRDLICRIRIAALKRLERHNDVPADAECFLQSDPDSSDDNQQDTETAHELVYLDDWRG